MSTVYQAGLRVSEYLLEAPLGKGAFGEVWRARHHVWQTEHVAVKLPTEPQYVRYLQREGIVVHGLRHPNIIRVLGLDPYADTPYLVMELVDGPSLKQVIGEHAKGLPLEAVQTVLRGVLRGIAAAHAANIIHRDLKPGNVLLHLQGRPIEKLQLDDVKVGDFGLGLPDESALRTMVEQSASIARDDQTATLTGTLAYMAPEVRDAEQPAGPRSDLFAVGVMLFELLTGHRPVGAELPSTVRPEVPPYLDDLFRRLYARWEVRYDSASAALRELEPPAHPVPPPPLPGQGPSGSSESRPYGSALPGRGPARSCPQCQARVEGDDQYCTNCGVQLVASVRRCDHCGGYPGPQDRFCIFCGATLDPA